MTPVPVLRHAPMRWQRSAAARMPPCSANDSRVFERHRRRQGRVAQVLGHGRRVDHHAGVQAPVRVEEPLHLPERLVEILAEHRAVERAAHEPVAVLRRVDPVELGDQRDDLLRDGLQGLDTARRGRVDEGPDVQAAHRAVSVEPGVEPVSVENLAEARDVVVEPLGSDRGVLHERRRPAHTLAGRHQQAESRLAHLGQRVLLGGRLGPQRVVAVAVPAPGGLESVEAIVCLRLVVGEEGHVQQCARGRPRAPGRAFGTRACSATGRGPPCRAARSPPRRAPARPRSRRWPRRRSGSARP